MSQPRYLPGQRLGPYEILSLVGEGGMGQVYRGRDTRIDRIVAIKVLTGELSDPPGRRERFEREARVIGGLSHPHIGMLFDVGEHDGSQFLIMEFLEGETLAWRIGRRALPMEEVLRHAVEIADALSEAHRRGVIHRDLKPGNVMLTKSGAKIVDFGLAKLRPQEALGGLSAAPTREKDLTGEGVVVGTIQYMAPEQLEGKEVDARTDLFAFGEILYEMATGKRAFDGTSPASLIAAILRGEPAPISAVRPTAPRAIDRVVRKCLRKEPDERWQAASDLKEVLQWLAEEGSEAKPGSTKGARVPRVVAAAIAVASVMAILVWTLGRDVSRPFPVTRTEIPLSSGEVFPYDAPSITISADGRRIAYVGQSGNDRRIFVRELDRTEARPVAGTEGGAGPFFSPDGEWLGFFADGELKKVSLRGGAAVMLYKGTPDPRGGSWGLDDRIVFVPEAVKGLHRIAASGETPEVLTAPNREDREKSHRHPQILPDGQAVLFTMASADISSFDDARIEVLSLATGKRHVLIEGGMNPRYASSGHLLFARAGSLFAAPFDPRRLAITGPVTPVVQGVMTSPTFGHAGFAVSSQGTLVYAPGDGKPPARKLIWVYRDGRVQEISSEETRRAFDTPRLSPDGRHLAVSIELPNQEVWLLDLARGALTRSAWGWDNNIPIWTRDGARLTINSNRSGQWNLFGYPADGSGSVERLTTDDNGQIPGSWSPDGNTLAFTQDQSETSDEDIWMLPRGGSPEPFLATSSREGGPEFSPDGRFLAYTSDESGRKEVYVRPVSGPGAVQQVSTSGGDEPAWSGDGRELFYREGVWMMSVTIQTEPAFAPSKPKRLFEAAAFGDEYPEIGFRYYDVSPDGQRFVMVEPESRPPITRFHVVTNWFEELRRLAPQN